MAEPLLISSVLVSCSRRGHVFHLFPLDDIMGKGFPDFHRVTHKFLRPLKAKQNLSQLRTVSGLRINKRYTAIPTSVVQTTIPTTLSQYFSLRLMPTSGFRRNRTSASSLYMNGPGEGSISSAYRKHRRSFRLDGSKSGHYFSISFDVPMSYIYMFIYFVHTIILSRLFCT